MARYRSPRFLAPPESRPDRETALNRFRKRTRENSFAVFAVPESIRLKSDMQQLGNADKNASDYVTRTFQRIFGRAEKVRGAAPSLRHRLTRFPDQLEPLSQPK
jgi:hypothetical protein